MTRQQPPDDPRAWPVVFIEPDPAQAPRESRHPMRWLFVTVFLGVAVSVGSWFAGRTSAAAGGADLGTPPPGDVSPRHSVAALTPPPPRDVPPTFPVAPTENDTMSAAAADPPPAPAPRSRPRYVVPQTAPEHQPSALAHLSINSYPWGVVTIDDDPVGNTPMVSLPILPGQHRIRIEHAGFVPFDRVIRMAPGEVVRLTGIVLQVPTQ